MFTLFVHTVLYIIGLEDRICGNEIINSTFTSAGNKVTFKYVPSKGFSDSWSVIVTAFHEGMQTKFLSSRESKLEPRCEKTGLRGFRPGPTQTRLYSDRR